MIKEKWASDLLASFLFKSAGGRNCAVGQISLKCEEIYRQPSSVGCCRPATSAAT